MHIILCKREYVACYEATLSSRLFACGILSQGLGLYIPSSRLSMWTSSMYVVVTWEKLLADQIGPNLDIDMIDNNMRVIFIPHDRIYITYVSI